MIAVKERATDKEWKQSQNGNIFVDTVDGGHSTETGEMLSFLLGAPFCASSPDAY